MRETHLCLNENSSYRIERKKGNLVNKLSIKFNLNVQLSIYNFSTLKYLEVKI